MSERRTQGSTSQRGIHYRSSLKAAPTSGAALRSQGDNPSQLPRQALQTPQRKADSNRPVSSRLPHENISRMKTDRVKLDRGKWRRRTVYAMAAIIFMLGITSAVNSYITNRRLQRQIAILQSGSVQGEQTQPTDDAGDPPIITEDGIEIPNETPPAPWSYPAVSPDKAKRLKIPKLGVDAFVREVGLEGSAVDTPNNIYDVGWYNGSSLPSNDGGAAFIVGHVSGPTRLGVFGHLQDLAKGDKIIIELGDGSIREFVVKQTSRQPTDDIDMTKAITSVDTTKFGLNLMTCGGDFDASLWQYKERVLIRAVET